MWGDYLYFIKIDSLDDATKFCNVCEKYKNDLYVDLCHGVQVVDGRSILGVVSLMNKIVRIKAESNNEEIISNFYNDIEKIGAYKVKTIYD